MRSTGIQIRRVIDGRVVEFFLYERVGENGQTYCEVFEGSRHSNGSNYIGGAVSERSAQDLIDQLVHDVRKVQYQFSCETCGGDCTEPRIICDKCEYMARINGINKR